MLIGEKSFFSTLSLSLSFSLNFSLILGSITLLVTMMMDSASIHRSRLYHANINKNRAYASDSEPENGNPDDQMDSDYETNQYAMVGDINSMDSASSVASHLQGSASGKITHYAESAIYKPTRGKHHHIIIIIPIIISASKA